MPTQVSISGGTISYIYDATGVKLRKTVSTGTTTDYANNYVYENGSLKFFNHAEGYVDVNAGSFSYVYQYKDHPSASLRAGLGNIRLSYKNIGTVTSLNVQVQEENNYYPFGLRHKGYNNVVNGAEYPYKYNGKEREEELGLNMYDYGARNYDPALGRWWQIDPLAEIYHTDTPYAYVLNNPLSFIDPDGRQVVGVTKNDASRFHNVLNNIFEGEKFEKLRALFTRGEKNNKKTFDKISKEALSEALSGLEGDDLALGEIVASAINSDDTHKVEFLEKEEDVSSEGSKAIIEFNNNQGTELQLSANANGKLNGSNIDALGGGGYNVPTEEGSHSFIVTDSYHSNGYNVTSFHEVFGHGIASAKKTSAVANNANAIRTENLVLRVIGKESRQRDGSGKDGGRFHNGGKVNNPQQLPIKN